MHDFVPDGVYRFQVPSLYPHEPVQALLWRGGDNRWTKARFRLGAQLFLQQPGSPGWRLANDSSTLTLLNHVFVFLRPLCYTMISRPEYHSKNYVRKETGVKRGNRCE